jgi:hypothetical protein
LATFEEDIDVTAGTEEGVEIRGDSLAVWREGTLTLRSSNRANTSASQENQAVWLGWNNRIAGEDTTRIGPPARYSLQLPSGLAEEWKLHAGTTLDLMLGATNSLPDPRKDPTAEEQDSTGTSGSQRRRERAEGDRSDRGGRDEGEKPPVDLSVQLEDQVGRVASVRLGEYGPIRRPLETYVMRRRDQEEDRFDEHWEQILQTYSMPLGDFLAVNPTMDLQSLVAVRLVFDLAQAGEVVVDQIGFSDLDPAFLRTRVER